MVFYVVPNVFLRTKWIPEIESAMEDALCSASEGAYASSEAVFSDTIAAVSSCIRQHSVDSFKIDIDAIVLITLSCLLIFQKLVEEHDKHFSALVGAALEYLEEKERLEKEAELGRRGAVASQIGSSPSNSVENMARYQFF